MHRMCRAGAGSAACGAIANSAETKLKWALIKGMHTPQKSVKPRAFNRSTFDCHRLAASVKIDLAFSDLAA
eukprot:4155592-Alexandrium_andersonii.AAC.1